MPNKGIPTGSTPALFMRIKSAFWYSKCAFNAHKKRRTHKFGISLFDVNDAFIKIFFLTKVWCAGVFAVADRKYVTNF